MAAAKAAKARKLVSILSNRRLRRHKSFRRLNEFSTRCWVRYRPVSYQCCTRRLGRLSVKTSALIGASPGSWRVTCQPLQSSGQVATKWMPNGLGIGVVAFRSMRAGRPIRVKLHGKDGLFGLPAPFQDLTRRLSVRSRHEQPVCCVQSWRAMYIARNRYRGPAVLHAANRGSNAGDDIACNTSILAELVPLGPCRIRSSL